MNPFEGLASPMADRPGTPRAEIVDVRMTYAHAMAIKDRIRRGQPVDADARRMADEVVQRTRRRQLAESGAAEAPAASPEPAPIAPAPAAPAPAPPPAPEPAPLRPAAARSATLCVDCDLVPPMAHCRRCLACYIANKDRQKLARQQKAEPAPAPAAPPKLHVIREHTLQNIPAVLRSIAAQVENGDFDQVGGAVVALDGAGLEVFYAGTGEAAPNAHLLLHAGAAKMMNAVLEGKL